MMDTFLFRRRCWNVSLALLLRLVIAITMIFRAEDRLRVKLLVELRSSSHPSLATLVFRADDLLL
jgi:hypothetical protein